MCARDGCIRSSLYKVVSVTICMDGKEQGSYVIDTMFMCFPNKITKCFRNIVSKYTADTQIKPYHIPFIAYVGYNGGVSQKDICNQLSLDKSRVSTVIHELMDMGLVVNESDGKVTSIHLTESGKNMMVMCQILRELMHSLILQGFTEEEVDQLYKFTDRLNRRMDEILEDHGN